MGGFANNAPIVTDGLVFYVDAGNSNSYSGSGTTWKDLAGNNDGTLTNGPTLDSANGGSIVFDGTNDYTTVPNFNEDSNTTLSVFLWCNLHSVDTFQSNTYAFIINKRDNANDRQWQILYLNGDLRVSLYDGSSPIISPINPITPWNFNEWVYVGFTTTGVNGGNISTYFNGGLDDSMTLTGNRKTGSRDLITSNTAWDLGFLVADVDISNIKIYNRVLSATEVLQNYNALKNRFV